MLNFSEWQLAAKTKNTILNLPGSEDVERVIIEALTQFGSETIPSEEERRDFLKQLSSLFLNTLVNLDFPDNVTNHTQALDNTRAAREVLRNMLHGTVLH
jgi:hypothetical protein